MKAILSASAPPAACRLWLACLALAVVEPAQAQQDAAQWPRLLGPGNDGVYQARAGEISTEPGEARIEWRRSIGSGFSGPVVDQGRLVVFHRILDREVVEAIDPANGRALWRFGYLSTYRDDFGLNNGPRATPTAAAGQVFTVGAEGQIHSLDLESGELLWSVDARQRFGAARGFFGVGSAPVVEDGRVIVNVGGDTGLGVVALDAKSGELLWGSSDHEASYSSPVMARVAGERRAILFTREGLLVLDPEDGRRVHSFPWRSRSRASVNAASPVVVGDRVFLSASYGTGAVLLDLAGETPLPVWSSNSVLSNHYVTSVHHEGVLYGLHGRQESWPSLRAVDLATGEVLWSMERFGTASLTLAGDQLVLLKEDGELLLAPATPRGFEPLSRGRILAGPVRAQPALANGRLYARNDSFLVAVDLRRVAGER